MLNHITKAMHRVAKGSAQQTIARTVSLREKSHHLIAPARRAFSMLGVVAIAVLAMMFFKPEIADDIQALSPFSAASADTTDVSELADNLMNDNDGDVSATADADDSVASSSARIVKTGDIPAMLGTSIEQRRVTNWIAKRYRVADDATNMLVSAAYLTGKEINFDPLLILAVIAIESRFNPFAQSPVGAKGLMQVMAKVHNDKFSDLGGTRSALNPVVNIKVGSMILKEYVKRGGSVEAGLKRYVGAAAMDSDGGYGAKVLGEYDRLKAVASGKHISIFARMTGRPAPKAQTIQAEADDLKSARLNEKTALEIADRINKKLENENQVAAL
jgi:soluble lytic murein transglycosylase-like protein